MDDMLILNGIEANIYDYDGKEDLIDTLIEAIFNNMGISDEQINFLTNFLKYETTEINQSFFCLK